MSTKLVSVREKSGKHEAAAVLAPLARTENTELRSMKRTRPCTDSVKYNLLSLIKSESGILQTTLHRKVKHGWNQLDNYLGIMEREGLIVRSEVSDPRNYKLQPQSGLFLTSLGNEFMGNYERSNKMDGILSDFPYVSR